MRIISARNSVDIRVDKTARFIPEECIRFKMDDTATTISFETREKRDEFAAMLGGLIKNFVGAEMIEEDAFNIKQEN